ncbi:activating signal cointegrator 1-like [Anneissia japonica]|uniref:activating signal cointegrator 1-like n=1 Tax=Anneissia japonica TaxID=1529436 RepID=UPI0014257C9E|nr:activating signal cointegrator 1-like [Anneissia japonica]XP_033116164.1 activating signal cointegrator 1-like [Anneissia japonica]
MMSNNQEALYQWCCHQLIDILHLDSPQDVVQYLLSMESGMDLEDYLHDLLDTSNPKHKTFIRELLRRWKKLKNLDDSIDAQTLNSKIEHPKPSNSDIPEHTTVYRKPAKENDFVSGSNSNTGHKEKNDQVERQEGDSVLKSYNKQGARKKQKQKFVQLYSSEGETKDVIHLPGRHPCECQAQKHTLISNCLSCGRVVCAQEGSGPCLFCGTLVCTREEQEILARNSNKSEKLRKKLLGGTQLSSYNNSTDCKQQLAIEKAIKTKDRLIEFDRTSIKRTQIIDDESDYFATDTNQWLSKNERELLRKRETELREQLHGSRLNKKITLDFAGRRVVDSTENVNMYDKDDAIVKAVNFGTDLQKFQSESQNRTHLNELVNPTITSKPPKFVSTRVKPPKPISNQSNVESTRSGQRIQDVELQKMSDEGNCLSMHQPWASLFVQGIKKHEGRTWYTAHRGRLWIAATAKMPSKEEICELESFYKDLYEEIDLGFPDAYPTSCLLGCVDVVDCLSQEQYRVSYPDGESSSPFVIIAENFQELIVRFPIKGKHKIWKLTNDVHSRAKKGLRSLPKI